MRPAFGWISACLLVVSALSAQSDASPAAPPLGAGCPPLLNAAFQGFLHDQQRWAYTETRSHADRSGVERRDYVTRIDPSLPYAQQVVPEVLQAKPATAEQVREWAARNEATARRQLQAAEELAAVQRELDFHLRILERDVKPLLEQATVLTEDTTSVTYVIPLRLRGGPDALPFPEYQLTARVNRERREFEHVTLRQLKMLKIGAGKWSDGLIEVEFTRPVPGQPAVPSRVTTRHTNKPLFGPAQTSHWTTERTHFRRVTPYNERFKVNLAPLRLL